MADVNDRIAQGPARIDFSPLSTLFDSYGEGQKARRQQDIWAARRQAAVIGADGRPDYAATARNLLHAGDLEGARHIAGMVKDMRWGLPDDDADTEGGRAAASTAPGALPLRTHADVNMLLQHARDAVAQGAPSGEVLRRLRQWGVDVAGI